MRTKNVWVVAVAITLSYCTFAHAMTVHQFYALAQKQPKLLRKFLLKSIEMQLKGKVDMKHFTPTYNPWDQRLCVVPDGDLFKILRSGKASVETDQIEKTVKQFDQVVARIEAKDYGMTCRPDKLCPNCDMRFYCDRKNWNFVKESL